MNGSRFEDAGELGGAAAEAIAATFTVTYEPWFIATEQPLVVGVATPLGNESGEFAVRHALEGHGALAGSGLHGSNGGKFQSCNARDSSAAQRQSTTAWFMSAVEADSLHRFDKRVMRLTSIVSVKCRTGVRLRAVGVAVMASSQSPWRALMPLEAYPQRTR